MSLMPITLSKLVDPLLDLVIYVLIKECVCVYGGVLMNLVFSIFFFIFQV